MSFDLTKHLGIIVEHLELEPVLRFLQARGHLTRERCEEIRSTHHYPTAAAKTEALMHFIGRTDAGVKAFLEALRETGQDHLAKMIEKANWPDVGYEEALRSLKSAERLAGNTASSDSDFPLFLTSLRSGSINPDDMVTHAGDDSDTTESSARSRMMREMIWTCQGLEGSVCGQMYSWNYFRWCRRCQRYLCSDCLSEHSTFHKTRHWLNVKVLHQAVFQTLKEEHSKAQTRLDEIVGVFCERLGEELRRRFEERSLHVAFAKSLKIEQAGHRSYPELHKISLQEATLAAELALYASTRNSMQPSSDSEKLERIRSCLLGDSEQDTKSASGQAPSISCVAQVLDAVTAGISAERRVRLPPSSGQSDTFDTEAKDDQDDPVDSIDMEASEPTVNGPEPEPVSGLWMVGGVEDPDRITIWNPASGLTQHFNNVLLRPRSDKHLCELVGPSQCLVIGGQTAPEYKHSGYVETALLTSPPASTSAASLPRPLAGSAAASLPDGVFVCGGRLPGMPSSSVLASTSAEPMESGEEGRHCFVFQRDSSEWKAAAVMTSARHGHCAVALGDSVWALGGRGLSNAEFYNAVVDKWYGFPPLPWSTEDASATSLDRRILLAGGRQDSLPSSQSLLCDPREGRWDFGSQLCRGRVGHSLLPWRGRVYAIGGLDDPTVEVWEPRMDAWEMMPGELTPHLPRGAAYIATE